MIKPFPHWGLITFILFFISIPPILDKSPSLVHAPTLFKVTVDPSASAFQSTLIRQHASEYLFYPFELIPDFSVYDNATFSPVLPTSLPFYESVVKCQPIFSPIFASLKTFTTAISLLGIRLATLSNLGNVAVQPLSLRCSTIIKYMHEYAPLSTDYVIWSWDYMTTGNINELDPAVMAALLLVFVDILVLLMRLVKRPLALLRAHAPTFQSLYNPWFNPTHVTFKDNNGIFDIYPVRSPNTTRMTTTLVPAYARTQTITSKAGISSHIVSLAADLNAQTDTNAIIKSQDGGKTTNEDFQKKPIPALTVYQREAILAVMLALVSAQVAIKGTHETTAMVFVCGSIHIRTNANIITRVPAPTFTTLLLSNLSAGLDLSRQHIRTPLLLEYPRNSHQPNVTAKPQTTRQAHALSTGRFKEVLELATARTQVYAAVGNGSVLTSTIFMRHFFRWWVYLTPYPAMKMGINILALANPTLSIRYNSSTEQPLRPLLPIEYHQSATDGHTVEDKADDTPSIERKPKREPRFARYEIPSLRNGRSSWLKGERASAQKQMLEKAAEDAQPKDEEAVEPQVNELPTVHNGLWIRGETLAHDLESAGQEIDECLEGSTKRKRRTRRSRKKGGQSTSNPQPKPGL